MSTPSNEKELLKESNGHYKKINSYSGHVSLLGNSKGVDTSPFVRCYSVIEIGDSTLKNICCTDMLDNYLTGALGKDSVLEIVNPSNKLPWMVLKLMGVGLLIGLAFNSFPAMIATFIFGPLALFATMSVKTANKVLLAVTYDGKRYAETAFLTQNQIRAREEKDEDKRKKLEEQNRISERSTRVFYFGIKLVIALGFGGYFGYQAYFNSNWGKAREHDLAAAAQRADGQKAQDKHDAIIKQYDADYPEFAAWRHEYESCYAQSKDNPNLSILQNIKNKGEICDSATTKKLGPPPKHPTLPKFMEEHHL